jgi:hypothetical protein
VRDRLASAAAPGLELLSIEELPPRTAKAAVRRVEYEMAVPAAREAAARQAIQRLLDAAAWPVAREEGRADVDIRPYLEAAELLYPEGGPLRLRFALRVTGQGTARPREVLGALGLADLEQEGFPLSRIKVEIEE